MNTPDSPQQKADTLFGGRPAVVLHEDGSSESITVRQIPLGQYPKAYGLIEDEFAISAFCCVGTPDQQTAATEIKPREWIFTLQPESYEQLQAVVQEVNSRGFFSYAQRRQKQEQLASAEFIKTLPIETISEAAKVGARMNGGSAYAPPSPKPPRR